MQKTILVTLLALLCCTANIDAFNRFGLKRHAAINEQVSTSANLGSVVTQFLGVLKDVLPCGFNAWNLEPLAPMTVENYILEITNANLKLNLSASNIIVSGINSYEIIEMSYNEETGLFAFDVMVKELQEVSESVFKIWALVAGYPVDMAFDGLINVQLKDLRVVGSFTLNPPASQPNTLEITNLNVNIYLGDVIVNNWNNLWDIAGNNFVDRWGREFVLMWVQQIQGQLNGFFQNVAIDEVNDVLATMSMQQLVNSVQALTNELSAAQCSMN